MLQRNKAAGAVLAASRHYTATNNNATPVNLGLLRRVAPHLDNARGILSAEENESNTQIRDLTSILLIVFTTNNT